MNNLTSIILNTLVTATLVLFCNCLYAADVKYNRAVNILTWWGYIDYPEIINAAEKRCHAKISFDQYYSNDEFLRRWREQRDSYDIIIFSNTIYPGIKNEI